MMIVQAALWLPSRGMHLYARSNTTHPRMGIGVHIAEPVPPHPDPRTVVDENRVSRPHESRTNPPAPRPEGCSDRDGGAEVNCSRHDDAGTRGSKDDVRVVPGHVNHSRIQRQHLDITARIHEIHILIWRQIAITSGHAAHPLHRVHHFRSLVQNSIPKLLGPGLILRHHVWYRREWQQTQHAG